jgi:hypothetical protein
VPLRAARDLAPDLVLVPWSQLAVRVKERRSGQVLVHIAQRGVSLLAWVPRHAVRGHLLGRRAVVPRVRIGRPYQPPLRKVRCLSPQVISARTKDGQVEAVGHLTPGVSLTVSVASGEIVGGLEWFRPADDVQLVIDASPCLDVR